MTDAGWDSYDLLVSRPVPAGELRAFLVDCFAVTEAELYVGHRDQRSPAARSVAAYCTYDEVSGHFAMTVDVGLAGRSAVRIGRAEYAERFAARFGCYVLYGDDEPFDLWTLVLADGGRLLAELVEDLDEEGARFRIGRVAAPIPELPDVVVDESLGRADWWR